VDLAAWKVGSEEIQNHFVGGGSEDGDEHGGVSNVKVSVAGWITMMRTIRARGHGKLDNFEGSSARVFGQRKPVEVVCQRGMIRVLGVGFNNRRDHPRGKKAGQIIDMPVGIVTLETLAQPDNLSDTQPLRKSCFNFRSRQRGITVGMKKTLFSGEKSVLSVGIERASLKDEIVSFEWCIGKKTGGSRDDIIFIPRTIFLTPTIEGEVMGDTSRSPWNSTKHKDRSAIAKPGVIIGDGYDFKIWGDKVSPTKSLMDFIRGRTVFGNQINPLSRDECADHLQVGFLNRFQEPRPGLGVMGPSEPSGFMRFPLRGKTVSRPINPEGGG